jgi:hypothetical protein
MAPYIRTNAAPRCAATKFVQRRVDRIGMAWDKVNSTLASKSTPGEKEKVINGMSTVLSNGYLLCRDEAMN